MEKKTIIIHQGKNDPLNCLKCGKEMDGFTSVNEQKCEPSENAIVICAYCGFVMKYGKDGKSFEKIKFQELRKFQADHPEKWKMIWMIKESLPKFKLNK